MGDIGELLELEAVDDRVRAREPARARIGMLDARIAELRRARSALARLADACGKGGAGPCPILAAFDRVGEGNCVAGQSYPLPN